MTIFLNQSGTGASGASMSGGVIAKLSVELLDLALAKTVRASVLGQRELRGQGQIEQMILPKGWIETSPRARGLYCFAGLSHFFEFRPPDSPETAICHWSRGLSGRFLSPSASTLLLSLTGGCAHNLSEPEINAAKEIFAPHNSQDLLLSACRVGDLNGKRLLMMEGSWRQAGDRVFAMFYPAEPGGSMVEQLHFEAPEGEWERYMERAVEVFRSIVWR